MAGAGREYKIRGISHVGHMSLDSGDDTIYIGDGVGNIVHIDRNGTVLGTPLASDSFPDDCIVHHTVRNADLFYTYWMAKGFGIKKIANADKADKAKFDDTPDFKINDRQKKRDGNQKKWKPISIHASNNNVVVGMTRDNEGSVAICDSEGNLQQRIRWDEQNQLVYKCPQYISEKGNGDICTSDSSKNAVMLVNPVNNTFTQLPGVTDPKGICTDTSGNIIVCFNKTVNMFDKTDGWRDLLEKQKKEQNPVSVCVTADRCLYVGFYQSNIVKMIEY